MADIDTYTYHVNPVNLKKFLEHIQTAGVPSSKVTFQYISSVGFTSSNDRAIITVLKAIGFLDKSGLPTDVWRAYRNKSQSNQVLAGLVKIRATYPAWSAATIENLREAVVEFQLIQAAKKLGLCTNTEMKALHGLLNKRNECAHPSDFYPDMNGSLGYISELLSRVATLQTKTL